MQISVRIFSKNLAIKTPLQNPSKIEKIYFEDIIQEILLQNLSQQCWNQLQSMHKYRKKSGNNIFRIKYETIWE